MPTPNISATSATVGGTGVTVSGGFDEWTLDGTIDVFDFDGDFTIVIEFENDPLNGGTADLSDPFAILSEGNLDVLFDDFDLSLVVNDQGTADLSDDTATVTLTVNADDLLSAGEVNFTIGGRGDGIAEGDPGDQVFINFACFAQGTEILTKRGAVPVERLAVGDLVCTRKNGFQPVKWIASRALSEDELRQNPQLRPIRIAKDAFAPGAPASDLLVSPQHRVFVQSPALQVHYWLDEALAPAKGLVNHKSITVSRMTGVTYYHLLFDEHELVQSNGLWTESLFPGREARKSLDAAAIAELKTLFPSLFAPEQEKHVAAPFLSVREASVLAHRLN